MEELKKKYTPYTESERMSYIREYLSTSETKYQFAKRTGICRRLLILWLDKLTKAIGTKNIIALITSNDHPDTKLAKAACIEFTHTSLGHKFT